MKLRLLVEFDPSVNRWSAIFPELPGCGSAGDTEAEAIESAQSALNLWFSPCELEIPENGRLVEVTMP